MLGFFAVDFYFDIRARDSFSWIDPAQYYRKAIDFAAGDVSYRKLAVPTIYPFILSPATLLGTSIPAILWTNCLAAFLMAAGVHWIRRETKTATATPVILAAILSSPLLIGLSRELYMEFFLSAIVLLQYCLWFKSDHFSKPAPTVLFALLFCFGLMTKMTYPLFFIGPFVMETALLIVKRKYHRFFILLSVFVVPAIAAAGFIILLFPSTLHYYLSFGNTTFPVMRLAGPLKVFSLESITFYFLHLGKSMLLLLTPFLVFPVAELFKRYRFEAKNDNVIDVVLWLWLLTPLVVLIFTPVKEPRHVAPCVVPAVMLIFRALERIFSERRHQVAVILILVCAVSQYLAATHHRIFSPYFFDRPVSIAEIEQAVFKAASPISLPSDQATTKASRGWKFPRNFVATGFEANSALAIAYNLFPGVVFNLDLLPETNSGKRDEHPYDTFYDLYTLAIKNIHNRRCGWNHYFHTLDRAVIIKNADYIIIKARPHGNVPSDFPEHTVTATIEASDGTVSILVPRTPVTIPYRILYGREFITRNRKLEHSEMSTIFFDMFAAALIRGDIAFLHELPRYFPPDFVPGSDGRNIYWIAAYKPIFDQAFAHYQNYIEQMYPAAP
ncbi:MAG: hypothetical protein QGH40_12730 [bacterium]|nr:hypothetical protein [bacterium]